MRKLFLVVSLSVSMFATDKSNYDTPKQEQTPVEKLRIMKEKQQEIRQKLQAIPGLQKKLIALQQTIERASKGQRKMAQLYLKAQRICEERRAKDDLAGYNFERIQATYERCKKETGEDSVFSMHGQLMTDIASFKETINTHIEESQMLIDDKDMLENTGAYTDEAVLMLEEMVNGGNENETKK